MITSTVYHRNKYVIVLDQEAQIGKIHHDWTILNPGGNFCYLFCLLYLLNVKNRVCAT